MNRTKIDWPFDLKYTWNPITGCKRGCNYCYAKKIYERFNKKPFEEIVFQSDRICDPYRVKKPSTVFVGSMTDIWYWDGYQKGEVIASCSYCHQHTFLFLTKDYRAYHGFKWPDNCILGVTVELHRAILPQKQIIDQHLNNRGFKKFLSFEPITGTLKTECNGAEVVIVGAMTGRKPIIPQKDWIKSIKDHVPEDKIFWKQNIKKYV